MPLSHIGFAGATGAVALGVNPIYGLLVLLLVVQWEWSSGQTYLWRGTLRLDCACLDFGSGVLFLSLYSGYATEAYALLSENSWY